LPVTLLTPVWFVLGVLLLVGGANALVKGASRIASAAGLSGLAVGLTVVAFASSAPELAVTLGAAFTGRTGVALGNAVGSNIFNVLVVLGLAAVLKPLAVSGRLVRLDMPVLLAASALVLFLALDGRLGGMDGSVLVAGLAAYTAWQLRRGRREAGKHPAAGGGGPCRGRTEDRRRAVLLRAILKTAAGALMVALGARLVVLASVDVAKALGVSELVTGLTLVAAGSSLPEGVTTLLAVRRGERDMAVGNIVGSNIFNLLAVLGLGSLAAPGGLPVPPGALTFDLPIMIGVAAAAFPVFLTRLAIGRVEGLVFLSYYAAYSVFLFLRATRHDALPAFSAAFSWFLLPLTGFMLAALALRYAARRRPGRAGPTAPVAGPRRLFVYVMGIPPRRSPGKGRPELESGPRTPGAGLWIGKSALGGIAGGFSMALFAMATMASAWGFYDFLHRIAATAQAFRPPAMGFEPASLSFGLALHLAVSAALGAAFGLISLRFPGMISTQRAATLAGLLYGAAAWLVMGRFIGPALNPALDAMPFILYLASHLLYGWMTAWALHALTRNRELGGMLRRRTGREEEDLGMRPA
jgi:cation:H+ antiporter